MGRRPQMWGIVVESVAILQYENNIENIQIVIYFRKLWILNVW